jgi:hypothetical protein
MCRAITFFSADIGKRRFVEIRGVNRPAARGKIFRRRQTQPAGSARDKYLFHSGSSLQSKVLFPAKAGIDSVSGQLYNTDTLYFLQPPVYVLLS